MTKLEGKLIVYPDGSMEDLEPDYADKLVRDGAARYANDEETKSYLAWLESHIKGV